MKLLTILTKIYYNFTNNLKILLYNKMDKIYTCVLFIIIGLLSILVLMMILYYPLIYKCQQDFSAISKNVVDISQEMNQIIKKKQKKE